MYSPDIFADVRAYNLPYAARTDREVCASAKPAVVCCAAIWLATECTRIARAELDYYPLCLDELSEACSVQTGALKRQFNTAIHPVKHLLIPQHVSDACARLSASVTDVPLI